MLSICRLNAKSVIIPRSSLHQFTSNQNKTVSRGIEWEGGDRATTTSPDPGSHARWFKFEQFYYIKKIEIYTPKCTYDHLKLKEFIGGYTPNSHMREGNTFSPHGRHCDWSLRDRSFLLSTLYPSPSITYSSISNVNIKYAIKTEARVAGLRLMTLTLN